MRSRKVLGGLLALLMIVCLLSGCGGGTSDLRLPGSPETGSVLDVAGVLSDATEAHIQSRNETLKAADAKVWVAALDLLGGREAADYAAGLFQSWGLGDRDLLILLSVGEGEYYLLQGSDVGADLTDQILGDYAWNYLEHDFANGDYDAGVRKVFDAIYQWYETRYDLTPAAPEAEDAEPDQGETSGTTKSGGVPLWLVVLLVAAAVAAALIVVKLRSKPRQGSSNRYGGVFGGNRYHGSRKRR